MTDRVASKTQLALMNTHNYFVARGYLFSQHHLVTSRSLNLLLLQIFPEMNRLFSSQTRSVWILLHIFNCIKISHILQCA